MNNTDYTNIIKIINPEDEKWYDKLYQVSFIVGNYSIDYKIYANDTQQALEQVVAYMENSGKTGLFADEAVEKIESDDTKTDGEIRDEIENNYIYVDGTEYGALQPHYIDKINLDIHECLNESNKILESEDNKITDPNHDVKEYVYDNDDIDDLDMDTIKEDIEDYLGEEVVSDELAQEILNTINNIKNTVKYYTPYNGEKLIELNDNHTIYDLDVPDTLTDEQFSEATDEYWDQARIAMEDLENELGQDVYGEGRMGRHICVKNTYDNAINYEKLVSKQKEAEKNLINNINDYMKDLVSDNKTESKKVCENDNEIISKYHTRTNYENKEDKEESIKEDADLVSNSLEELKYRMNDSKSIKVIDSYINSIKEDILKNID